jgi:hypothetical protein
MEASALMRSAEGGIFWCYGLVAFARYLGSFSELGWAWNISPTGEHVSAEFVESLVIFIYGITNTWMERFGIRSGDPYTAKQVQHISIAVRHFLPTYSYSHSYPGHVLVCWTRWDGNRIQACSPLACSACCSRCRPS